jgi:hypothetical protein
LAQKTAWTAAALTESDINTYLMGEGGAWSSWSPTITQSGSVAYSGSYGGSGRWGRKIVAQGEFNITGTGTAANIVTVALPATAVNVGHPIGNGWIYDASTGLFHFGQILTQTTTTASFIIQTNGSGATYLGTTSFTAALASGDIVCVNLCYEAAS